MPPLELLALGCYHLNVLYVSLRIVSDVDEVDQLPVCAIELDALRDCILWSDFGDHLVA